jgi:hypothetical protein
MKVKIGHMVTAWMHFALGLMIVAESAFIILGMRYVLPACKRALTYVDTDVSGFYAFMPGETNFLGLLHTMAYQTGWWVIAFAIAWALFEWRVRGENKQRLRLSVMASLALLLFAAVAIFTTLMVIPTARAAERLNARHPEPIVAAQMASLDRLVGQLEEALARNDLAVADDLAHTAMGAAYDLANTGAAASTLLTSSEQPKIEVLRTQLNSMAASMREAWIAARRRHPEQVQPAMEKFRETYAQMKSELAIHQ